MACRACAQPGVLTYGSLLLLLGGSSLLSSRLLGTGLLLGGSGLLGSGLLGGRLLRASLLLDGGLLGLLLGSGLSSLLRQLGTAGSTLNEMLARCN